VHVMSDTAAASPGSIEVVSVRGTWVVETTV
jgi:hypothetical protein